MSADAITAGDPPDPLPSELLEPSGVAAWVIRPEDLDRLNVLTTSPRPLSDGYLPDAETWTPAGEQPPPEVLALMRIDRVLGNEGALSAHGVGRIRGLALDALRRRARRAAEPRTRGRIARAVRDDPPNAQLLTDPHRPHPDADDWPDDAVLVTYRELRALIALHLTTCSQTMPGVEPWRFMQMRAKAMQDGEVPLLLSEVLE
jgi:hypothetical protein